MILGKLWKAIAAQFNKLANAIRGYDPIAEMQYEYDRRSSRSRRAGKAWPSTAPWSNASRARSRITRKRVAVLEAKIKAYLNAGDRETAGKFALDLKRAKDDLAENEKQLGLHEQAYQNNLLEDPATRSRSSTRSKHKISKYDAELKMSRAEAEMAELANQFHFDVTTDFGQAEQMIQDQIDKNRGQGPRRRRHVRRGSRGYPARGRRRKGDGRRRLAGIRGLTRHGHARNEPRSPQSTKELGPGSQDPRAASRDLSRTEIPRRSH